MVLFRGLPQMTLRSFGQFWTRTPLPPSSRSFVLRLSSQNPWPQSVTSFMDGPIGHLIILPFLTKMMFCAKFYFFLSKKWNKKLSKSFTFPLFLPFKLTFSAFSIWEPVFDWEMKKVIFNFGLENLKAFYSHMSQPYKISLVLCLKYLHWVRPYSFKY